KLSLPLGEAVAFVKKRVPDRFKRLVGRFHLADLREESREVQRKQGAARMAIDSVGEYEKRVALFVFGAQCACIAGEIERRRQIGADLLPRIEGSIEQAFCKITRGSGLSIEFMCRQRLDERTRQWIGR